jgi:hypothetical protein
MIDGSFWLGGVFGAFLGLIFTVLFQAMLESWKHRTAARIRRLRPVKPMSEDLRDIDLFQILSWSKTRPLDPKRHRVVRDPSERQPQQWLPQSSLDEVVEGIRERVSGVVCEVSGLTTDHGESGSSSKGFIMRVRPSNYADSLALPRLLADDSLWEPVRSRILTDGILGALEVAPAQSFFIMLTLNTRRGEVLRTRRSASAASAAGMWSLGVCETMNATPDLPGHEPESLFALARRAAL